MYRLVGASEAVRSFFRPWALEASSIVTEFGGATALLFLLSLLYWTSDRRHVATVVSYALVALSVVLVLKTGFGLPRPPADVQAVSYAGDPYGFPSGHAVAAVVVYGGLATVYDRRDLPTMVGVTAFIAAIALSRVVIGVHYLGDVIVGTALGITLLVGLWKTLGRNPVIGFGIATVCGGVALAIGAPEAPLALGGSIGGFLGAAAVEWDATVDSPVGRMATAVVGVPTVLVVDGAVDTVTAIPLLVGGNAVLVVLILTLPTLPVVLPIGRLVRADES